MDEETAEGKNFEWARILVKTKGRRVPESLQVVVGQLCFAIKLWWELPPWVSKVFPYVVSQGGLEKKIGSSRASGSMGHPVLCQGVEVGKMVSAGGQCSRDKRGCAVLVAAGQPQKGLGSGSVEVQGKEGGCSGAFGETVVNPLDEASQALGQGCGLVKVPLAQGHHESSFKGECA